MFSFLDFISFQEGSIFLEDLQQAIGQSIYKEVVRGYMEKHQINHSYIDEKSS